jgi:hypothetical protein
MEDLPAYQVRFIGRYNPSLRYTLHLTRQWQIINVYEMPTLKAGKTQGGPVFLLRMPVWLRPKCHSRRWLNLHMRLVSHVSHPNAIHDQSCFLQCFIKQKIDKNNMFQYHPMVDGSLFRKSQIEAIS